jgi:hypothetical protein
MVAGGWSFGAVNKNEQEFISYVEAEAKRYNNRPVVSVNEVELKGK